MSDNHALILTANQIVFSSRQIVFTVNLTLHECSLIELVVKRDIFQTKPVLSI